MQAMPAMPAMQAMPAMEILFIIIYLHVFSYAYVASPFTRSLAAIGVEDHSYHSGCQGHAVFDPDILRVCVCVGKDDTLGN